MGRVELRDRRRITEYNVKHQIKSECRRLNFREDVSALGVPDGIYA